MTEEEKAKMEKKMETIRNLLRRAESTPFENEANECLRAATKMMTSLAIDEELLWANDPERRSKIEKQEFTIPDKKAGAQHRRIILNQIAQLNNCKMWYKPKLGISYVAGFPKDLLFVDMLYTSIITQMNFKMAMAQAVSTEHHKTFRTNFTIAFCDTICLRLVEFYAKNEAELDTEYSGSQALVLVSRKKQVDKWVEAEIGKLRSAAVSSGGKYSPGARAAGELAGKTTDISAGRQNLSQGRRALNG